MDTKFFRIFSLLLVFAGFSTSANGMDILRCPSKNNKVVVCHIPPGNPDNMRILAISENAIQAHIGHGDRSGICEDTSYQEMKDLCGICDADVDSSCI